jgi:hypothetical protein
MATIKFYANTFDNNNTPLLIPHGIGSGIGFYGPGYATSVPIANYQDTTWLTNSNGTATEQVQLNNTKYINESQVSINGANPLNLDKLPNKLCPLEIRFEHDQAVRVQNAKLRVFNGNNISNFASGVAAYVFEARHPSLDQLRSNLNHRARSSNTWFEFDSSSGGTPPDMPLTSSPGTNGANGGIDGGIEDNSTLGATIFEGSAHESPSHSWFIALSISPDEIGSKLFGLYMSVEYL